SFSIGVFDHELESDHREINGRVSVTIVLEPFKINQIENPGSKTAAGIFYQIAALCFISLKYASKNQTAHTLFAFCIFIDKAEISM
ncbi:MAG TPA: hypothetical protein DCY74_08610, partial [Clostridiales bacterium]|nr:hypothetical protein [Clostridiales bacterium]